MKKDALVSACGLFRYWLCRQWDPFLPMLVFCMLNPSTADASTDDATIRKCIKYARAFGYGGIMVVNCYAYRTKNPIVLRKDGWLVGPDNDAWIMNVCHGRDVICAWGVTMRSREDRTVEMLEMLRMVAKKTMYLKLTEDGIPQHPLYLLDSLKPQPLAFS